MRVIISGGGTAGHVTPAISIAEVILEREPQSDILFIGRAGGEENIAIKKAGYRLIELKISGFNRKISIKNISNFFMAISALSKAKKIIKDFSPDVVIGTGGYVCWPVVKAAQGLHIPTVIHESNAYPGMSSRMLAKKCHKVLLNFPGTENELKIKSNAVIVGNPLTNEILNESRESARKKLKLCSSDIFILSFGGSGGAETINSAAVALINSYSRKNPRIKHTHASGRKHYDAIISKAPDLKDEKNGCRILPYIENMGTYMMAADIVICRCGAMTLSEVAAAGAIPILIPSPNVTDNHQYKNAKLLLDKGAAIMIEESELNERTLIDAVKYLEKNPQIRKKMSLSLAKFHQKNSRELIYREIRKLIT